MAGYVATVAIDPFQVVMWSPCFLQECSCLECQEKWRFTRGEAVFFCFEPHGWMLKFENGLVSKCLNIISYNMPAGKGVTWPILQGCLRHILQVSMLSWLEDPKFKWNIQRISFHVQLFNWDFWKSDGIFDTEVSNQILKIGYKSFIWVSDGICFGKKKYHSCITWMCFA